MTTEMIGFVQNLATLCDFKQEVNFSRGIIDVIPIKKFPFEIRAIITSFEIGQKK